MIYIHYYFADFAKKNSVEIFSDAKTTSYFSQKMSQYKKDFSAVRRNMVKGVSSTQEAEKLIDAIEQNAVLSEERASYFKENYNADIASAKSMREAAAIAETLAQEVQLFLEQLQNTIQEIVANLNLNLETIKEDIVNQYCSARNVVAGSSNFRQKVLQDFLTHEGIKKLGISGGGTGQKVLDSSIRNMILLAEALPEYGTGGGSSLGGMRYSTGATAKKGKSYEVSKNGSQTLDIIQRKLQGLLNNVIGTGAEIAWAQAEKVGEREVAGRILTANAEVSGSNMVTIKSDDQLIEDSQKSTAVRVSKPDVQVTLADKEIVVNYGVSVKQYKFNSQTGAQSVSIVSDTSLLEALEKYGKQNLYSIYNLAGGHANKNAGYSSDSLNDMWDNLVKQVAIANFLDALVGMGDLSVLYLVVNGQVIPVVDILNKITDQDIVGRFVGDKAANRNVFVRMNQWIGDKNRNKEAAVERSTAAEQAIYGRLSQTKLDISIKNLLNFI